MKFDYLDRNSFKWLINPILMLIKSTVNDYLDNKVEKCFYVERNDLVYQILLSASFYGLKEIFLSDYDFLDLAIDLLRKRDYNSLRNWDNQMDQHCIRINNDLINSMIEDQVEKSRLLYSKYYPDFSDVKDRCSILNKSSKYINHSPFREKCVHDEFGNEIIYKAIDYETSYYCSRYFHYLHTSRTDEIYSFGAYNGIGEYPIAYLSFSPIDRKYKREMLKYYDIDSSYALELTRAWNSNNAPINNMSLFISYAVKEISIEYKRNNKKLCAITTVVNPNLGFKGTAFKGSNFKIAALRPAKLYYSGNRPLNIVTRREMKTEKEYDENKLYNMPLNEMLLILDKSNQYYSIGKDIMQIPSVLYRMID